MMDFAELPDRILGKIAFEPNSGHWLWMAAASKRGYGKTLAGRSMREAHRVVYELLQGPVPDGLELDHLCRTNSCVNPTHLEAVTHRENIRRGATGSNHRGKTHCPQGHPYNSANTYIRYGPKGDFQGRACRECTYQHHRRKEAQRRCQS